jgi:Leucine-rich repeat (LRR) protein
LGDRSFRIREAACRNLAKAGNKALAALTRAAQGNNLEVALRAVGVLKELFKAAETEAASDAVTAALVRIAASASPGAHRATLVLIEIQEGIVRRIEQLGGSVHSDSFRIMAVNLDNVKDLTKALPLLRRFPALQDVSLSNRHLNDSLMAELKGLPRLKNLNLFRSSISDDGLKCLKTLPKLVSVPMGMTKVTDAGLVHLRELKQLEYVGLRGNNVTDAGLEHLRGLTNLTGLHLSETKVTDAGLVHLRGMTKLQYLPLSHTKVTDTGLEHLRALRDLRHLDITHTRVTPKGVTRLRQAIPKLGVSMGGRN